jgi:hypothetical protein
MTTEQPTPIYRQPGAARDDADGIFQQELRETGHRLLSAGQPTEAGLLHLAAARIGELSSDLAFFRRPLPATFEDDDPAPRARTAAHKPRPPAAGPRHKFGPAGTCVAIHGTDGAVCGAAKGRPGRPAAALATVDGVTKADPPSRALPLGDKAADAFTDGGLGSSGVRR